MVGCGNSHETLLFNLLQVLSRTEQVALFHRNKIKADAMERLVHFYGDRQQLPNFKAEFERFAPNVILDLIPYTETQAQAVVQVFSDCTQRIVAISSGDFY